MCGVSRDTGGNSKRARAVQANARTRSGFTGISCGREESGVALTHKRAYDVDREARTIRRRASRTLTRTNTVGLAESGESLTVESKRELSPEMAEVEGVVATLGRAFRNTVNFYKAEYGGGMSHADAVKATEEMEEWRRKWAAEKPARELDWGEISALAEVSLGDGLAAWVRLKEAAENDLASGYRASQVLGGYPDAWTLAQFLAIRDSFCDEWQPRGGIESAMIDMLAVAFSLQMYWASIAHERATRRYDEQKEAVSRFEVGGWKSPFQSEADAVDQAHRLADGYNRQFLRVLRQLRDLRRYTPPVIVNNGGQVNVAASGGQQVNVAQ